MTTEFVIAEHWLEILVGIYLIGMILYGHWRGFIKMSVSAAALLITILTVHFLMPVVTNWVRTQTPVYDMLQDKMEEVSGIREILDSAGMQDSYEPSDERMMLESLPLPNQIKSALIENNNVEMYAILGAERFIDYVGRYLTDVIVRSTIGILLAAIVFIGLQVATFALDLVAKLPIISGINQLAGAVLGAVEALLAVWILFLLMTALSGTEFGRTLLDQVDASIWLSWLYRNNVLTRIALGVIHIVI